MFTGFDIAFRNLYVKIRAVPRMFFPPPNSHYLHFRSKMRVQPGHFFTAVGSCVIETVILMHIEDQQTGFGLLDQSRQQKRVRKLLPVPWHRTRLPNAG